MQHSLAHQFAMKAHGPQVRRYTGEPYIKHCENVAQLVWHLGDDAICIAYLHDVLEDTDRTYEDVEEAFGRKIALGVLMLTNPPTGAGNRKIRNAIVRERLSTADPITQSIKVADLIDNTPSIVTHDPGFAKVYLQEKRDLLKVLTNADSDLLKAANELLLSGLSQI